MAEPGKAQVLRCLSAAVAVLLTCLAGAASASASSEISIFNVTSSDTQAGGHPDLQAEVGLANPGLPEVARDLTVNLPSGVFGNPGAILKCRSADFAVNHCSPGSQAGLIELLANYEGDPDHVLGTAPVYNVETVSEDETARLAFVAPTLDIPISVPVSVRSASDYGLQLRVSGISQQIPLRFARLKIWGFPADPIHDAQRFRLGEPGEPPQCAGVLGTDCLSGSHPEAGEVVRPYVDNPSLCGGAQLSAGLEVSSYQDPANPARRQAAYPATVGCERQKFDPFVAMSLTSEEADSPSGLNLQLKAAQFLEGKTPSQSTLRSATLLLPDGLTINPDAADGQSACSDAQAGFGTDLPGSCPDNSKIGTVDVITPALDRPLVGSLYIGEPKPGDQYRVFMIFDGEGIHAKLFASLQPDPQTGRLTIEVDEIPQVPFEEFDLHLFASDRGLVATPLNCTIYSSRVTMLPWNGTLSSQVSEPTFGLRSGPHGGDCPGEIRPFHPSSSLGP